jgi:2Fe-2S ferredoxin
MSDHDHHDVLDVPEGAPFATVHFQRDGKTAKVRLGTSVLHAGMALDLVMENACGEVCACSTCHVWVEKGSNLLSTPSDDEEDTLDKASLVKAGSRLSCQAKILKAGHLEVAFPPGTHQFKSH